MGYVGKQETLSALARTCAQGGTNAGGFGKLDTSGIRNVNCLEKEIFLFKPKEKAAVEGKHPPREGIPLGTRAAHLRTGEGGCGSSGVGTQGHWCG